MRTLTTLTLVCVLLSSGCGGNEDLVGTWTFDLDASLEALQPELDQVAPGPARAELRAEAVRVIRSALADFQVTLEIEAGGKATVKGEGRGAPQALDAAWRFDSAREELVVTAGEQEHRYLVDAGRLLFPVKVPEVVGGKVRTLRAVMTRS